MKLLIAILLVTSSVSVFALDPFLKSSSGDKCYYDDGSVINNGGRICPTRLNLSSLDRDWPSLTKKKTAEQIEAEARYREAMIRSAKQAGEGLGKGLANIFNKNGNSSREKKLARVYKDYPNAKSTLRSPKFLEWATEIDARRSVLMKAYNGDPQSLDSILTTYHFMMLGETNPKFGRWIVQTYGQDEVRRLYLRADRTGDYSVMKSWLKQFRESNN